jgi:hypothetical protein
MGSLPLNPLREGGGAFVVEPGAINERLIF